ncbi:hypothetical protein TorRG33x02_278910 [Trema orientale]|uniref:Uncharacterized protein n=1 Tax=Trema orientale TaxID=63057 RepID=A0A2P5CNH8_TREOI|nr:hypothetical protein TorRG33x02_278910 [Trema orientale]
MIPVHSYHQKLKLKTSGHRSPSIPSSHLNGPHPIRGRDQLKLTGQLIPLPETKALQASALPLSLSLSDLVAIRAPQRWEISMCGSKGLEQSTHFGGLGRAVIRF